MNEVSDQLHYSKNLKTSVLEYDVIKGLLPDDLSCYLIGANVLYKKEEGSG